MSERPQYQDSSRAEPATEVRAALLADVDAIHGLIAQAARTTTVLPRSRENICERVRDFIVAERDGRVVACGALGLFTPSLAEVKSLVVAPECRGQGLGGRVVRGLIEEAGRLGVRRLFALTDNPPLWEHMGFKCVDKTSFPHKVWNECVFCPKFLNCHETAVEMMLAPIVPVTPGRGDS